MNVLDITPVPAPRQVRSDTWRPSAAVLRYRTYKDAVRLALPRYVLPEVLHIEFHIPMPKSWSAKKQRVMISQYHTQKPDIDNLCKAFMDAFGNDDAHVAVLHASKFWSRDGHILLDVSPVDTYSPSPADDRLEF